MAAWRYEISLLLVLKTTLCISLDRKHSKRNFVPTCYHVISFMYLGHEDIYSEKLTYIPLVTYHQSDKRQLYFAVLLL